MKNGYFQLMCGNSGTALKIFAPKDGGEAVGIKELLDYLSTQKLVVDATVVSRGISEAAASGKDEYVFQISPDAILPPRGSYRLTVSEDRIRATARFYPPAAGGDDIYEEEFLKDLAYKKIIVGIKKEELDAFFSNPSYCTDIVVAEGKAPRHGTDARIEYYFETDLKAKPTLNEDGSVDFFHLNTISHCNKGDLLARLYPEDPGSYGASVYGEKLRPREVKRGVLKFGRNILLSEDKLTITADTAGHVTLVDGKVFVSDILEVENVDISTGNIDYNGSVHVTGNVCTNFSVKAQGNIEVMGIVEGAYLEAGENITIARGMNGMARGVLKAGGNVIAKFIENAKVTAGGYVSTESILHSDVSAATEINVTGKRGFITGGHVAAGSLIAVKTLGSAMGADTLVEVGVDPSLKIRLQQLQKEIAENNKTVAQIHPVLTALTQKLAQGVKLRPEQMKSFQEMLQKENQLKEQLEADMAEYDTIQQQMGESHNAKVEVTGDVFPGTKICISDVSMVVKNGMSYCRFVKDRGDVKMTAL